MSLSKVLDKKAEKIRYYIDAGYMEIASAGISLLNTGNNIHRAVNDELREINKFLGYVNDLEERTPVWIQVLFFPVFWLLNEMFWAAVQESESYGEYLDSFSDEDLEYWSEFIGE